MRNSATARLDSVAVITFISVFGANVLGNSRENRVSGTTITESLLIGGIGSSSLVPNVELTSSKNLVLQDQRNEDVKLLL